MDLKTYLRTLSVLERRAFAKRCGTTYGHLRNIARGERSCAETLALNVERESGGSVPLEDLRADLKKSLDASGYFKGRAHACRACKCP